jgi:hypothetical protein
MKNLITKTAITLCVILAVVFSSCTIEETKRVETESYHDNDFEVLGYPVKLHYVKRSGMKYMIASGSYGEAGVSICNLTLDSLQVEFYKRSLE